MEKPQPSAIFGLNFLQDMKGIPTDVAGEYDSQQELWIIQEELQQGLPSVKDDLVNSLIIYLERNGLSPAP